MDEETFTYATLRKIERMENTQPRLQKLEGRFWERLGGHLELLRRAFQDQQEEDPTSRRTVVLADELRNTHRLAENIWSLREKKIVQAALAATRRAEGRVDPPDHITDEERILWESSLKVFDQVRTEVLKLTKPGARQPSKPTTATPEKATPSASGPAQTGRAAAADRPAAAAGTEVQEPTTPTTPRTPTPEAPVAAPETATEAPAAPRGDHAPEGEPSEGPPGQPGAQGAEAAPETATADDQGGTGAGGAGEEQVALRLVWALEHVPLFTGRDMVNYELVKGEVGTIPDNAAKILEQRGVVRILPEGTDPEAVQKAEGAPEAPASS